MMYIQDQAKEANEICIAELHNEIGGKPKNMFRSNGKKKKQGNSSRSKTQHHSI